MKMVVCGSYRGCFLHHDSHYRRYSVDDMKMVWSDYYRGCLLNHDSYYRCNFDGGGTIVDVVYFFVHDVHRHDVGSFSVRVTWGNRSATWKSSRSCSSFYVSII